MENKAVIQFESENEIDLAKASTIEASKRKAITDFIASQLKEGVDYGVADNRSSKKVLLKAGAEKFCSLMKLTASFEKDNDTLSMIPDSLKNEGIFAFICFLKTSNGKIVSEGRGTCTIKEKYGQINTAVKIAEKRALLDATLRAFSISDAFTQDIDDPEPERLPTPKPIQQKPNEPKKPMPNEKELGGMVTKLMKELGWVAVDMELWMEQEFKTKKTWKQLTLEQKLKVYSAIKKQVEDLR